MKRYSIFILILVVFGFGSVSAQDYFIKEWLISEPFQNKDVNTRLAKDYLNSESEIFPLAGETTNGKVWFIYTSPDSLLDFLSEDVPIIIRTNAVIYTCFYLSSDKNRTVKFYIGSDDGFSLFLNNHKIYSKDVYRSHQFSDDIVEVNLKKGLNRLLFKVTNGTGDWRLSVKIEDVVGIKHILNPPAALKKKPVTAGNLYPKFIKWSKRYRIGINGEFNSILNLTLINRGMEKIDSAILTVQSPDKIAGSLIVENIIGGEVREAKIKISYDDLIKFVNKNTKLKVIISFNDSTKSFSVNLPSHREFLKSTFGLWKIENWEKKIEDGKIVYSNLLKCPDYLKIFDTKLVIRKDDNIMNSIFINDKKIKEFRKSSGDIIITPGLLKGKKLSVKVVEISGSDKGVLPLGFFTLVHPAMSRYIESVVYIKKLFDQNISEGELIEKEIVNLIYNKDVPGLETVLEKVEPTIEKFHTLAKSITIHMLGNSPIDLAWLWRYPETIEVAKNTFKQMLENMEAFPELKYSQSQAQLYYWIEKEDPELFDKIKAKVKSGRWEIVGGMWVESDVNMPSGEALARQFLYGKRYFKEKFGVEVVTGYLPDTFGHPRTLPMILKNSGIKYFAYFRPDDKGGIFHWKSPDNSSVLTCRPQEWYNRPVTDDIGRYSIDLANKYNVKNFIRFYGVGDNGGGPTKKDIKKLEELDSVYVYPDIKFSRLDEYFEKVDKSSTKIDTVEKELNFVFRGCWTSQAEIKKWNRKCEYLLPAAETFSYFASRFGLSYPEQKFKKAWRNLLFNQFHDILPGSGIGEIYDDAIKMYEESYKIGKEIINKAVNTISANINTVPASLDFQIPVTVFNSLNWARSVTVETEVEMPGSELVVVDKSNKAVPTQVLNKYEKNGGLFKRIMFIAEDVPPVGFKTFFIKRGKATSYKPTLKIEKNLLENRFFRVEINPATGNFISFYDKLNFRQIIPEDKKGNVINLFEDNATSMTAWRMKLTGKKYDLKQECSIEVIEKGDLRGKVRIKRESDNSEFIQVITILENLPFLIIDNYIKWNEKNTTMKISFPTQFETTESVYEIPFGWIKRENNGDEYPSQKWIDIYDENSGLAVLNDSKYGFSVDSNNVVYITCLRSPIDPDPHADEGEHNFSFALYTHKGDFKYGNVIRKGFEFNTITPVKVDKIHIGDLPSESSFLKFENDNLIATTIKKSEEKNNLLIRFYEIGGEKTVSKIELDRKLDSVSETDFIEWKYNRIQTGGTKIKFNIEPFKVKTLVVAF